MDGKVGEELQLVLMTIEAIPEFCKEQVTCSCTSGKCIRRCSCKKDELSYTIGCVCRQESMNPFHIKEI